METNILPGTTPESPIQEKAAGEESVLEIVRRLFQIVSSQQDTNPSDSRAEPSAGKAEEAPENPA
jgi:hypothetical protein